VAAVSSPKDNVMSRRYSSGPPVAPFIGFVLVAFLLAIVLPYMLTH
jgi:hypothetical protein